MAGGSGNVELLVGNHVDRFGQQGRVELVIDADADFSGLKARLPLLAWTGFVDTRGSDGRRQVDSQSSDGNFAILVLAPFFARLSNDARREMGNHDRRFYLISMLPPGTTRPRSFDLAISQEFFKGETGGVGWMAQSTFLQ